MLQFVTKYPCERSIPEQVKAVVAGGCRWIELSAPALSEDEMRQVAKEIIPVCKEADAFVIMREHLHLAAELRLHGILLDYSAEVAKTRQQMGGEAVIGVTVDSLQAMMDLKRVDIDYFVASLRDTATRDRMIADVVMAREKGLKTPIVAEGEFSIEDMRALLGAGFSGIALSSALADAPDPEEATRMVLEELG